MRLLQTHITSYRIAFELSLRRRAKGHINIAIPLLTIKGQNVILALKTFNRFQMISTSMEAHSYVYTNLHIYIYKAYASVGIQWPDITSIVWLAFLISNSLRHNIGVVARLLVPKYLSAIIKRKALNVACHTSINIICRTNRKTSFIIKRNSVKSFTSCHLQTISYYTKLIKS